MACRLLLVDDHPALTRGLAALFNQEPDLEVDGQFAHGEALLTYLRTAVTPADLVLLDLHLPPPYDGLSLLPHLRQEWPALRVLIFSSASSPTLIAQAAAAGAHGFLDKSAEATALLAAIRAVHSGQLLFPARMQARLFPASGPAVPTTDIPQVQAAETLLRLRQLSVREREIISLIREGLSSRAIAARLMISEFTVSTHRRNLMHKLGVHGVAELVRLAHDYGI
jgi:DNA-binding NarL/FixJ family response regulator